MIIYIVSNFFLFFFFFVITDNAAMNIFAPCSWSPHATGFLWNVSRNTGPGVWGVSILQPRRPGIANCSGSEWSDFYTPVPSKGWVPVSPHLHQYLVMSIFQFFSMISSCLLLQAVRGDSFLVMADLGIDCPMDIFKCFAVSPFAQTSADRLLPWVPLVSSKCS